MTVLKVNMIIYFCVLKQRRKTKDENAIGYVLEGSSFLQFRQGSNLYGYSAEEGSEVFVNLTIEMDEQFFNLKGM